MERLGLALSHSFLKKFRKELPGEPLKKNATLSDDLLYFIASFCRKVKNHNGLIIYPVSIPSNFESKFRRIPKLSLVGSKIAFENGNKYTRLERYLVCIEFYGCEYYITRINFYMEMYFKDSDCLKISKSLEISNFENFYDEFDPRYRLMKLNIFTINYADDVDGDIQALQGSAEMEPRYRRVKSYVAKPL